MDRKAAQAIASAPAPTRSEQDRVLGESIDGMRSARVESLVELRRLTRSFTGEAIRTVLQVMVSGSSDKLRLEAANAILDRAWGKAPMAAPMRADPPDASNVSTDEERRAQLVDYLSTLAGAGESAGRDH